MMRRAIRYFISGLLLLLPSPAVRAQSPSPKESQARAAGGMAFGLAPSVVRRRCEPGETITIRYSISSGAPTPLHFVVDAMDTVVKNGERAYVQAGITPGGMAATAVASPAEFDVPSGGTGHASVTVTLPVNSSQRAVVLYFRGKLPAPPQKEQPTIQISLGALIACQVDEKFSFTADGFKYEPQSETANVTVSYDLTNTGNEPASPQGTLALVNSDGKLVARAPFERRELLPGERRVVKATCPKLLPPGRYRVVSVFELAGVSVTAGGEIASP